MDTEAGKELNASTVGTAESEKSENDAIEVKSDATNYDDKSIVNAADDSNDSTNGDQLDNNNDENNDLVKNDDKNDSDDNNSVDEYKNNDVNDENDVKVDDDESESVTKEIDDIHVGDDDNGLQELSKDNVDDNDDNVENIEAEVEVVKSTADDDDLPPPEPESEPPADEEPPSYEAQVDDTPAENEPEPEAEPEAEPERPPSPDAVPVVTSHNYHPRLCIIRKWPDFQGYGFNLHAEKEKKGQYIGLVDANSPAEDADLRKGDRIIEVNGDNIEDDTHQQVIQKIKAGGDVAKMLVVDSEADEYFKNNGIQVTADMSEVITCETRPRESSAMTFIPRLCHVIKRPDFPGYGFNLHAEKERGGQYIGQIDNNSPAQEAGLREYDRIIEVNGANIENETHQQVIARIKSGGDETKLLVVDKEADNYYKGRGVTVSSSMSEVKLIQSTRPAQRSTTVTNGDSSPAPTSQPMRVEPAKSSEPAQANGGDLMSMNLSAKEMRELLARKKKNDPKQKSNMDFKSKFEIFQKM